MKRSIAAFSLVLSVIFLVAACSGGDKTPSLSTGEDTVSSADGTGDDSGGTCVPKCGGKECGDSGCPGYSCGYCGAGMFCDELFKCAIGVCTPGKSKCVEGGLSVCAEDGLSWLDPVPCPEGDVCQDNACVPEGDVCQAGDTRCFGNAVQECDDKGAWGDAVACPESKVCANGQCVEEGTVICDPGETRCAGPSSYEQCSVDGTEWMPAKGCPGGETCENGECVSSGVKSCDDVLTCMLQTNCGDPEAGCLSACFEGAAAEVEAQALAVYDCIYGFCGKWGPTEPCFQTQQITGCAGPLATCKNSSPCEPACAGKECGGDGCGGSCGSCGAGQTCESGKCTGGQGCNGITYEGCCDGTTLYWCEDNKLNSQDCAWDPTCGWNGQKGYYDCDTQGKASPYPELPLNCPGSCTPNCFGKECGDDGCGGTCGGCPAGMGCVNGTCTDVCTPNCVGKNCGTDGCGGSCGTCPGGAQCLGGVCQSSGDGCSNIAMCALACNFDEACLNNCWNKGDSQAKQLFQNLLTCVAQVCGMMITEQCLWGAIEGPCQASYNACMND